VINTGAGILSAPVFLLPFSLGKKRAKRNWLVVLFLRKKSTKRACANKVLPANAGRGFSEKLNAP